jgi:hypothetical protein
LEHHPLQAEVAANGISGYQLATGLFRPIDHDRGRLEQLQGRTIGTLRIDDRRNAMVWRDRQEFRLELVAFADVDRDDLVGQAEVLPV